MHKVWLLLLPGFPLVDVSGMLAVFEAANTLREQANQVADYEVHLVSLTGGPVISSIGVPLSTKALPLQFTGRANTLVITRKLDMSPATDTAADMGDLQTWLWNSRKHLVRCAVLGIQNPSSAWPENRIAPRYEVPAPPNPLLVREERAGYFTDRVAAHDWPLFEPGQGLDLALSWIEEDRGTAFADTLASRLPDPRSQRYGVRQYRSALIQRPSEDARLAELHLWIATHLREELNVKRLAQQLHMSTRSFARFYARATGLTPACGVQQIRLEAACRLIETSKRPLKAIAAECGYSSQEVMRRVFLRSLGMTPREYKRLHAIHATASGSPRS